MTVRPSRPRMIWMGRGARLVLVLALTLSVGTSAFASCMPVDSQPSAEMACCDHVKPDCGQAMQAWDCCRAHNPQADRALAAKPIASHAVSFQLVPLPLFVSVAPAGASSTHAIDVSSLAASPPIFLLGASFRI